MRFSFPIRDLITIKISEIYPTKIVGKKIILLLIGGDKERGSISEQEMFEGGHQR